MQNYNNVATEIEESTSVDVLNTAFENLSPKERLEKIYDYYTEEEILFTSSFGTNSAFLLHLLSQVNKKQKVHFINTGYLFKETLAYKEELEDKFGLDIIEIHPHETEHDLTKEEEWWVEHPKMCCAINKIAPLDKVKKGKKIWVSGVLKFQTEFRSNLDIFAEQGNIVKFHPILDMNEGEFLYQISYNKLPKHPLADLGYGSVGCTHCTQKGESREGRWANSEKTECGLHTHYFTNKLKLNESK